MPEVSWLAIRWSSSSEAMMMSFGREGWKGEGELVSCEDSWEQTTGFVEGVVEVDGGVAEGFWWEKFSAA